MSVLLYLCVALTATLSIAEESAPDCPNLAADKLAKLQSLVPTDLDESTYPGETVVLYTTKSLVEEYPQACIKSTREVKDNQIIRSTHVQRAGAESTVNSTADKVSSGVYVFKTSLDDKPSGKGYALYSKNGVLAVYYCMLHPTEEQKKLTSYVSISVKTESLTPPIADAVQASIAEAKTKLESNSDIVGEIAKYENPCQ